MNAALLAAIEAAADAAFEERPGPALTPAQAEQIRRLLPAPQAGQQAA